MKELIKELFKNEYTNTGTDKDYRAAHCRGIEHQQNYYFFNKGYNKDDVYDAIMEATLRLYERGLANPDLQVSKRSIQYRASDLLTRRHRAENGYTARGEKPKYAYPAVIHADYNSEGVPLVDEIAKDEAGELIVSSDYGTNQ